MSVIQNIRTKYAKLAGGVIAVALVAFILMDALSSRSGSLFGNDTSVATVNGEKIDYIEYTDRTNKYDVLYGSNQPLDDNGRAQVYSMALQDLIKETLIKEEAEKLGLTVTEQEKKDMIYSNDPDKSVKNYQAFKNPNTQAFDPQYVKLFEEQANQIDPSGKMMEHWQVYKDYIIRNSLVNKYNKLYSSAAYVPSFLAEVRANQQAHMASADYIGITIQDLQQEENAVENIKLTDADYKEYMNQHKEEFYVEESNRDIEYVSFDVVPAARDTARALGFLNEIKEDFQNAKDDESFVNRNSEDRYTGTYVMKEAFESRFADSVFNAPLGQVIGPLYENQNYKLIKVEDSKSYPDSVKCRHILIKTANQGQAVTDDSVAESKIDSVIAAIKSGASFNDMVQQYSEDDGSKEQGGEYTFAFSQKANLSKEFGDFIFDGKTGQAKKVKVENSSYAGYHYIEILNQGPVKPALKIAVVTKALYAGDETENEIYANATEFASESASGNFDSVAANRSYQKRSATNVNPYDYTIYGLGPCREVIKWTYNAEKGDVSQVLALNNKYVVAKLTSVNKKGMKQLTDELRNSMSMQLKEQKLLEQKAKEYSDMNSLSAIAEKTGKTIQQLDSFRGNNSFTGPLGYAPKVVGYAFSNGAKDKQVSPPIKEQSGIYFVKVKDVFKQQEQDSTFMAREKEMMQMETRNTLEGQAFEQLKKNADIEYNPDMF